jgi:hypothetical protein
MKIHKNCGGEIINKTCKRCSKTWKPIGYLITREIESKSDTEFDPKAYRRRIREGKDIWK